MNSKLDSQSQQIERADTLRDLKDLYYNSDIDADVLIEAAYALGIKYGKLLPK